MFFSKPVPRDVFPPSRLHHLKLSKQCHQLGPTNPKPELMGGHSYSKHHSHQGYDDVAFWEKSEQNILSHCLNHEILTQHGSEHLLKLLDCSRH